MQQHIDHVVRMAELEIDPTQIEAYKALLSEEIESSVEKEAGVLMLHAVSVKGSPQKIRLLEVYASQDAYEAHLQAPHFLKYKSLTANMVTSLDLVDVETILMRAK